MGVYPKKILKAFSGLDTGKIDMVNNAITSGAALIPGIGTAVSAGLKVGGMLDKTISGDGSSAGKNIIGSSLNPLSSLNSVLSGKPLEAIPFVGGFVKAKRVQKEQAELERMEMSKRSAEANQESNQQFSRITFKKGGSIPGGIIPAGRKEVKNHAVILGGKDHEEGGNAIVDLDTNEKVAESEREELLFAIDQTAEIEKHIDLYDNTGDKNHFVHLGKYVAEILKTNTIDHSKKLL